MVAVKYAFCEMLRVGYLQCIRTGFGQRSYICKVAICTAPMLHYLSGYRKLTISCGGSQVRFLREILVKYLVIYVVKSEASKADNQMPHGNRAHTAGNVRSD